jgi:hypothetical protein
MTEVEAGAGLVPRLRRSHGTPTAGRGRQIILGIDPQPFRAGLKFWRPALRA